MSFKIFYFIFCVCMFCLHPSLCIKCTQFPRRPEEGMGASGAGVIAGCKPPYEYRRWNWGTWQEQPGLLTVVPSLQPLQCLVL